MDWIDIQELPKSRESETLWFKVDGEVRKGTFKQWFWATDWSELETVY
tara:strand:+ start:267 stop:410 length:144 start_codon:yes stop_codon:yes gene_type:complete